MNFDWLSALGAQDQSIESSMARSSMLKEMEPLLRAKALQQQQAQEEAQQAERQREFDIRTQETQAQRDETKRLREQAEANRKLTERRNRYNTAHDNMKPGDRLPKDAEAVALEQEFVPGNQFEPDPNDPEHYVIYRKHEYDIARAAADRKIAEDAIREKRAAEAEALRVKADKRAEAEEGRRVEREKRAQATFDRRQKMLDDQVKKLPPVLAQQANREMADAKKAMSQGFFENDEDYTTRLHGEYKKILDRIEAEAAHAGIGKATVPSPSGRGATPPGAAPAPKSSFRILSVEPVK